MKHISETQAVGVNIINGRNSYKTYYYLCPLDVSEGDLCVAEDPDGKYVTVKVVELLDQPPIQARKRIAAKVDLSEYFDYTYKLEKKKKIEAKLDRLMKQQEKIQLYSMFAAQCPEMKGLLEEYNSL